MKYLLAQNGEPYFHITAHQYAGEGTRHAASELQKYLLKSTGAAFPYFSDRCGRRGPEIRIGENVRGHQSDLSALTDEGFRIFGDGEDICITGKTDRAVLYGVYRFLERYCGFYCFSKDAEVIEKRERLEIEEPDILENPAFAYRESYFRDAFDGGFAVKNRLNGTMSDLSSRNGGKIKWFNLHHAFRDLVQPELYFDTHPEYFSLVDGKRTKNGQLCLSNPDVLKIAKATLRRWIRENPACTVFSVAQNDNMGYCTCPACAAVDAEEGCPQGSILRFVNALADDIAKDYPDVRLHNFAYHYSTTAPRITVPRPNVIIRLCNISCRFDKPFETLAAEDPAGEEAAFVKNLADWGRVSSSLHVWSYCVNFKNYLLPFFHFHALAENFRMYRRVGVTGVFEEGNFAYGGGASMDDLKSFLIGRLLWNPDEDVDALIDRYLRGVYGETSGTILREYIDLYEAACCAHPLRIYLSPDAPNYSDALADAGLAIFDRALAAAENETYAARIRREQLAVRFLHLARLPMDAPGREAAILRFIDDVKANGITEIIERQGITACRNIMLASQYLQNRSPELGTHTLYYIMQ